MLQQKQQEKYISLDGKSLTTADLMRLGDGVYKIKLSADAEIRVTGARELIKKIISEAKASCLSWVPEQGTVGASGDLAPLAHLALGLIGEGRMWSPQTGWTDSITGLALINGTQLIASLGAEALERAAAITQQADVIAALTLETLKGTNKAFNIEIHAVRPHPGQILVAQRFRSLVHSDFFPSEITDENLYDRVQDAYTLRCCPQALDFLSIGVHELASISERRIERLCNPSLSNLPAFLVKEGGLNSGFMVAHCTAAALVSENKVLCHPASVDSLSTSAATEDHVSMGGWAARKALKVVEHVEQVLAIELLAACQALEFHRPLKTTAPLEKVYELVRSVVRSWDKDRVMSCDIVAAHQLLREEKSREQLEKSLESWRYTLERRGMKVSRSKTEYMCVNEREGSGGVRLQGEEVEKVSEFRGKLYISLDGKSLTTADLVSLGKDHYKIKLSAKAEERVIRAKDVIEKLISEKQVVYGVNTGFGKFAQTVVEEDQLKELQENLVRSTSAASCLSWVPEQGTVGASGDLAPLAHLALGLMGEGRMWSPQTGWTDAKTGLSLINGTQFIASLGAEAVERAAAITRQADVIAALTLETLKGTNKAFDIDVHAVRPHPGQILVAQRFRSLLHSDFFPSEITDEKSYRGVQDAYTLRCCPQLVFPERGITISAGNFHGEYPAKALDFLAIGVHELASISERRIERLCNPSLSNLPAFLVKEGGINTGFMVVHCTAAALVSENKVLCHPASVDSLSTSAAIEDHVSMGGWAARKALKVVEHVEQVLAIELLAACQALEFHRPLKSTAPLEKVYELVRSVVRPWDKDRVMSFDVEAAHQLLLEGKVWEAVLPYMEQYKRSEHVYLSAANCASELILF
ncbi:histidine ammonia-lyase [Silurus meridionalis]|nr:histidine ammonia-lyase [Silurus meridionalis]